MSQSFLLDAVIYRERTVLRGVATKLQRKTESLKPFDAWNACIDDIIKLAMVHIERIVFERFIAAVTECKHEANRQLLQHLCFLFGLWSIEKDMTWFLENGYVSSVKSREIRSLVIKICNQLAPHVNTLIDAFDIPDQLIGSSLITPE